MKNSKLIVTLMAAAATTLALVSTAFAAPAGSSQSGLPAGTVSNLTTNNDSTRYSYHQWPGNSGATNSWQPTRGTPQPSAPAATSAPTATAKPVPTATAKPTPTDSAKPTPTAAPTASSAPVSGSMSSDESRMINLVNQDRASNGLKPLTFDSGLRAGALAHSQDMAQNNYFSHTSPTQGDFSARIKAAGVKVSAAGENIAEYSSVDAAEAGFMNSPGHRANILGDFTRVGIGIVSKGGTLYITQWFAK